MKITDVNLEIILPKNQLNLFGCDHYFKLFIKLFEKGKLPNSVILTGPKGSGKSTFAYHIINYLFSQKEENKYLVDNFCIDKNNLSYKYINTNSHPNFFLIENVNSEKEIKIDQIRNLLRFLTKSTYGKDLKIIMIDNVEHLNLNSSNALLKAIEEPLNNTFFFLVHDSSYKVLHTILSRCIKFRFFFSQNEKKNIFQKLSKQYENSIYIKSYDDNFYFDTPGNVIRHFLDLREKKIELNDNTLSNIFQFIEIYKNEKSLEILSMITLFIEKFYYDLCFVNNKNLDTYFFNYTKILKQLDDMKRFNLDGKNIFMWIKNILINEKR